MAIVAVRAAPVLAATVNATVPFPLPLAPDVTVIHDAAGIAVQAHDDAAVTVTVPFPPPAAIFALVGAMLTVHACAWLTVKVWPPMVSVALRPAPVLAATENATVPLPVPLAPDVIVIHGALLVAVHAHPLVAVTVTEPVPPPTAMSADEGAIPMLQAGA